MSRFSRLDFDETPLSPTGRASGADRWPDQDDASCLKTGDDLFRVGQYEPALLAYSRALRFNKDRAEGWVGQIRCLLCLGEYPEAATWSSRALERFPQSADLLACKGLSLVRAGEAAEGVEFLDGAVEKKSPSGWVWLARGEGLLATREDEANAQRCFFKALELSPNDAQADLRVGIAWNRARRYARALPHLQKAARDDERNPLALYERGLAHEGLGERDAAIGMFERALALRSDYREADDALHRVRNTGPLKRFWTRLRNSGGR